MPRPPHPLPVDLGDAFSCADARLHGVTMRRLRAADLEAPFRGSRLRRSAMHQEPADDAPFARDRAAQRQVERRARACAPLLPGGAFFAARTAAVIFGAPIPPGAELEVAVLAPARAPRRRGVRGIKIAPNLAHVTMRHGLPVATPATAWAMLGARCSVRELVVLGDALVRVPRDELGTPHPELAAASLDQLDRSIAAGRRPGLVRLREARALIRVGSSSPLETDYRLDAAAHGLPEPVLDCEIRDRHGRLLGISEIVYPGCRTVVEIEGDHHRTSRAQWDRDIEKYRAYVAAGWEVVRLTGRHVRSAPPRAASIVREVLVRRGWRPGEPA